MPRGCRIHDLQRSSQRCRRQIGDYQSRVEAAPMVEQELASMHARVELEKTRYTRSEAHVPAGAKAEDLARKQGGERFSVLYPATCRRPSKPRSAALMAIAIVPGLVLGAAAAVGREFMDRSVHDARALQSEFEVPVLGEIPRIPARRRQ